MYYIKKQTDLKLVQVGMLYDQMLQINKLKLSQN